MGAAPWQAIDTAPKNGSAILVSAATGLFIVSWIGDGWFTGDVVLSEDMGGEPTHWMPLPEPPEEAG